jgi:hypothetical protein
MSEESRPFRDLARQWAETETDDTKADSGVMLCAFIEAIDAGFEGIRQELERMRGVS